MATFYVTFGQRYRTEAHPVLLAAHPDGWVEIEAESLNDAHDRANAWLGRSWAFVYSEDTFTPDYYPSGCLVRNP